MSRVRSSCSSRVMASGWRAATGGFAGTVPLLTAAWQPAPPDGGASGFARATSAGTSTCRPTRLWPCLAGCAFGSTSLPAPPVRGRLEALRLDAGGRRDRGDLDGPRRRRPRGGRSGGEQVERSTPRPRRLHVCPNRGNSIGTDASSAPCEGRRTSPRPFPVAPRGSRRGVRRRSGADGDVPWAWREAGRRGRCSSMGTNRPAFDRLTTGRAAIFTGGRPRPAARPPRRLALGAVRGRRVRRRSAPGTWLGRVPVDVTPPIRPTTRPRGGRAGRRGRRRSRRRGLTPGTAKALKGMRYPLLKHPGARGRRCRSGPARSRRPGRAPRARRHRRPRQCRREAERPPPREPAARPDSLQNPGHVSSADGP